VGHVAAPHVDHLQATTCLRATAGQLALQRQTSEGLVLPRLRQAHHRILFLSSTRQNLVDDKQSDEDPQQGDQSMPEREVKTQPVKNMPTPVVALRVSAAEQSGAAFSGLDSLAAQSILA
jgi:hypothetical protein